jgi:hypothetical protein
MYKTRRKFNGEYYYFSQDGPKDICQKTAKRLREAGYKVRVVPWKKAPVAQYGWRPNVWLIYTKPGPGSVPPRKP